MKTCREIVEYLIKNEGTSHTLIQMIDVLQDINLQYDHPDFYVTRLCAQLSTALRNYEQRYDNEKE